MKISTKGRYALRMLIDLAEHQSDGYIPLKEIAKRQGISKKYLEQIVLTLSNSNILQANRGSQGGYKLALSPDKYTVGYILKCSEGSLAPVDCIDKIQCGKSSDCVEKYVWQGLNKVINNYLDSITLQNIIDKKKEQFVNDYVI
ncbi:MAG: Rrf2 family transcriptional regulator [Candidatus Gastranaerophilales bacterium]|nr:Rrf2 family transcriptional regulator [Candidatus Gastranaerophilales bacterium]